MMAGPHRTQKLLLGFDDLAGLDATGADTNPLGAASDLRLDRTQIHIPASTAHIVSVRNVITELRTLAANLTYLSHGELQIR